MKKLHTLWLCIFLTGYFAVLSAQQVSQNKIGDSFVSNECLIKFKPTTNRNIIDSLGSVIKFTILEYYPDGKFYRVRIPSTTPVHLFISRLLQSSAIECAQPDYFISFFSSTSDLVSSSQWYLSSSENGGSNIDAAQKFIGGISSDLSVAIIDGGLLPDSISDFFKDARVLPKIIAEPNEEGRISRLIESIWHCLNNGARIITINAGAPDSPLLQNAIMQTFNRGAAIICAAADSAAAAKMHIFPAAYNQYCLAVTCHGFQGSQLQNSAAADYIDLSAPGEMYLSKTGKPGNTVLYGTSVAALYASATVVLLSSIGINSYDKIRQALEQSCFDPPPKGWDRMSGWGFLNALKTVQYFPKPDHDIMISGFRIPQWGIQGEQLQSIVTVKNQGNYVHDITLVLADQTTSKTLTTTTATVKPDQTSQFVFQWNTELEPAGSHLLSIAAVYTGDEDVADNTLYKEITIVDDKRDVEISGVECSRAPDEQSFNSVVQIWNRGTYTDMITIKVQGLTGTVLGQKSASIQPQSLLSIPVYCTFSELSKEKFIKVAVETSDLQDADMNNNGYICPLIFSSKNNHQK